MIRTYVNEQEVVKLEEMKGFYVVQDYNDYSFGAYLSGHIGDFRNCKLYSFEDVI